MRKVYRYNQLSKKAKEIAVKQVYNEMMYSSEDWSIETEHLQQYLVELVREEELDVKNIYWDDRYGISIDLSEVDMTEEYLHKVLDKKDIDSLIDLRDVGDYLEERLFDGNYDEDGFYLEFQYNSFDNEDVINFIMEYSDDEEIKAKYKFPLLFLDADSDYEIMDEICPDLEADFEELGKSLASDLTEKVNLHIKPLANKLTKIIKDHYNYLGSEEYYKDLLDDGGSYIFEMFLFNYQGEIILKDGHFVDVDNVNIYFDEVV